MSAASEDQTPVEGPLDKMRPMRIPAVCAVIVGLSAGALTGLTACGDDKKSPSSTPSSNPSSTTTPVRAVPKLVSQDDLHAYARTLSHPLYWAGPRENYSYELTTTADGSDYVRYLPPGVGAGDPRPIFLTVGTYPREDAFSIVQKAAKVAKTSATLPEGGLAVPSPRNPASVFVAYPQASVLVEIFSTDPDRSMRLARRQAVVPIQ